MDKNCVVKAIKYFYQFKKLENMVIGDIDFWRRFLDKAEWLSTNLYLLKKHVEKARRVGKTTLTTNRID
ncbi:hypothetical protein DVH24_004960 [Malus domestica]|uniref:Uncharacterized protein n=1 Tax=Malus domestica TaxID=3750 RepID=A0A498IC51_MALDO|nr:hypothetical protein DVH24_004960 [Malus domestica]